MLDMAVMLRLTCIALCVLLIQGRGPLCLDCDAVRPPGHCNNVKECHTSESCFSEHFVYPNGTQAFTFGCRPTESCPDPLTDVQRRLDLFLCDECCTGDLCNNNICRNGTGPASGFLCYTCSHVRSSTACSHMTHCAEGEVCYTEMQSHSGHPTFNMGCLRKEICNLFEVEIIGKREVVHHTCHECCDTPGCNKGACAHPKTTTSSPITAKDCWDLRSMNNITEDGIYQVLSPGGHSVKVRCDMTTDGGGWTIFQMRYNGAVDFDQSYSSYASGFGNLTGEFWMGNDLLSQFTVRQNQSLRVDICDWDGATRHAIYDSFGVRPPNDCYRLSVGGYHGDAGDGLIASRGLSGTHNNQCFYAPENDNSHSCAAAYNSGWWYSTYCGLVNPNGVYQRTPVGHGYNGVNWLPWKDKYSFKGNEMKFRPSNASPMTHEPFKCPVHLSRMFQM